MNKRFYLEVVYPFDSGVNPKYFYFNEDQRMGVVLDKCAQAGKIKNQNNLLGAAKLQLLSLKTGKIIPLNSILKSTKDVESGDAILMEYQKV